MKVDEQVQYSRQKCLLIHDVENYRSEDNDTLSFSIINKRLGVDIQPSSIDQTYCIRNKNKARKKGRAIVIKFTRYNIRKNVFINKRKFKGTYLNAYHYVS